MQQNKEFVKKYLEADDCPIKSAIDVIGGKWKPIIIWLLLDDSKRFGELHRLIPGITLKVLSMHLKELESDGIVIRKSYPEIPPRVEYSLSSKGRTLKPLMESLASWSKLYIKNDNH